MSDTNEDGVLIHGGDNEIYFIPSQRLDEFRVDAEDAADAQSSFEAIEGEVAGFNQFDLKPGVVSMTAFRGPVGEVTGTRSVAKPSVMYVLSS